MPPKRIVVALDSSAHARAAMETAADLARRLHAEVTAIFVEDVDLVRIAALPFVHEVGTDATLRPFEPSSVERRFRCEVRQARAFCLQTAERRQVQARFDVVRGAVTAQILAAAAGAEMVVLGRASAPRRHSPVRRSGSAGRLGSAALGRTARAVLSTGSLTVAIVTAERNIGNPLAAVFDGSPASQRGLELAIRLAGEDHKNLVVLIPGDGERAERLARAASDLARPAGIVPRSVILNDGAMAIAQVVRDNNCRALFVARDCSLLGSDETIPLVEYLDCPVFVVG